MLRSLSLAVAVGVLAVPATVSAARVKWAGMKGPAKIGGSPGKQGDFILLPGPTDWVQATRNVQARFPGAQPWTTWPVGPLREKAAAITDEQRQHEAHLERFDQSGLDVFLEIWPSKTDDVPALIDTWLRKLVSHRSVAGFSVDLEWRGAVDDATAERWDKAVKSHNRRYRLLLKHWDLAAMPRAYAKKSDVICVDMSSEADRAAMAREFIHWANELAPAAVGFQTGYPWDEDWWKDLADPIKNFGADILAGIANPSQEIGFLWVTVKSPLTPNWDLTRAASSAPGAETKK
jgi:hypothetical protein